MKLKTATVLLVAVLALGASDVFAQGAGFNFIGTGARARGMGGAFIGVADDATAISWNPAGLATLEKMEGSSLPIKTIRELKDEAEQICGKPKKAEFEEKIVAAIKWVDGTVIDVVRQVKE